MSFDEFMNWLKAAQTAFPSLKQWLGGHSEDGRKATVKVWRETLSDISFDKGMKAIDKLVAEVKLHPFGNKWEQLPGIVIGLCGAMSAQPKGDKRCICNGTGIVMVGIKYEAKTFDGNPLRVIQIDGLDHCGPIGAQCLCPVGEWVNACRQRKFDSATGPKLLPVYDPKKMTVWHGSDLIFKPAIEERDRQMMAHAMTVFDGVSYDQGSLDFGP